MKKRNCRKTDLEREQHDRAIRIRKMTDAQICEMLDGMVEAAATASVPAGPSQAEILNDFLTLLDSKCGSGNGIGKSTIYKLQKFAEAEGLLNGI